MSKTQKSETTTTTTPTSTTEVQTSTVSSTLASLVTLVDTQAKSFRDLHRQLKKLEKEVVKEQKRLSKVQKPKRKVVQKPVQVNETMSKFLIGRKVDAHVNTGYTRQVMMRAVSAYIKDKGIQLEENKKQWKPDKTLINLFSLDKKTLYTFMNINGLISRVVIKPPVTVA